MSAVRTPSGKDIPDDGGPIGLALSGSGLKASLFHIGVLARLADLDLLRRIDVVSAVSGGALIAALYHLRLKRALDADGDIDTPGLIRLVAALERDFLKAVQTDLRSKLSESLLANLKRLGAGYSEATRLGELLDRHLFRPLWNGDPKQAIELRELAIHPRGDRDFNPVTDNHGRYCKAPVLIIQAADLFTGRGWRFDAERMGEPTPNSSARRLSRTPRLAQSPYRRLPEAYAGMTLGRAVAASMATPDLLEPLPMNRLYPDPDHPSRFQDVQLADGQIADALGTDPLVERGCSRFIISDGGGLDSVHAWSSERLRAFQLDRLETSYPGEVVLIHLLSEIEAPEIQPIAPIGWGRIISDRVDQAVTSYGVERRLQKLIAGMRADLDAPSEVEAMTLMADGYLIAKRVFQRSRHTGQGWFEPPPSEPEAWRFSAVFDALRQPSKALAKHLGIARLALLRGPRLAVGQAILLCMAVAVGTLTLIALGAFWLAFRPEVGNDGLWVVTTVGLSVLAIWLLGRRHDESTRRGSSKGWLDAVAGWTDKARMMALAWPLSLASRFQSHSSRAFLKAGRLKMIGIKPVDTERRTKDMTRRREPTTRTERKAA